MPNTHHKLRDYQLGVLELLWQDSLATGLSKFEARRACGTGPSHSWYSEHIWLLSTERQGTVRSINSIANFRLCITGLLRGKHIQRPFWAKPFQEIVDPSKHQDCRKHISLIEIRVTQHLLPTFCYSLKQKRRGVLSKFQSMEHPGLMYFPLHDLFQQQDPLSWLNSRHVRLLSQESPEPVGVSTQCNVLLHHRVACSIHIPRSSSQTNCQSRPIKPTWNLKRGTWPVMTRLYPATKSASSTAKNGAWTTGNAPGNLVESSTLASQLLWS